MPVPPCFEERAMKIVQIIDRINAWVGGAVCWVVVVPVLTIVFEVVARYFFHSPTRWVAELNMYLLCGYILLGGGYTLLLGGHVKVDVFYASRSAKQKAIVDIVTSVLFFAFVGVLVWQSGVMTIGSIETGRHSSESMQWPLWPVQTVMIVGAFLMLLQGIAKLIRDIKTVRGGS